MIIGIGGWERCMKTGLGAILASNPQEFNIDGFQEYNIREGYGNLHLPLTPYKWNYLNNEKLKLKIKEIHDKGIKDVLIFIDEVEEVFNNRDYSNPQQKATLKGIGQHAKMGRVYIYTYQMGQPEDALLGPDKILRSNTRLEFEMRNYNKKGNYAEYKLKNRLLPDIDDVEGIIGNVSEYFKLWDHKEPVV